MMRKGLMIAVLVLFSVPAVASKGAQEVGLALVNFFHSLSHLWGIFVALLLIYYTGQTYRDFRGGAVGDSALYAMVGAFTFLLGFVNMEMEHGFGFSLTHGWMTHQMDLAVHMLLFVLTVVFFAYSYYRLSQVLVVSVPKNPDVLDEMVENEGFQEENAGTGQETSGTQASGAVMQWMPVQGTVLTILRPRYPGSRQLLRNMRMCMMSGWSEDG
ncbi:MAG: hypothetical protein SVU32_08675 [Candidatus Nanohaloarchaea archaeon]|nr:hypothetical protein [Candidatus Nanohaloarchaea archaeon]